MGRKKVGSIDYTPFILLGVIGVGAYYLLNKLGLLGPSALSSNNASVTAGTSAALATDIQNSKAAGIQQSASNSALSGYAHSIFTLGSKQAGAASDADQATIVSILSNVNNDTDMLILEQYFGTQFTTTSNWSPCALIGIWCQATDFPTFIREVLSPENLALVNQNFSGNGLSTQF